ncbi:MAG: hypothetical protein MJE77_34020, partial [Proteobacteria bacterium]|nr:hypothetical protein [Pseudomonadota bacterium]
FRWQISLGSSQWKCISYVAIIFWLIYEDVHFAFFIFVNFDGSAPYPDPTKRAIFTPTPACRRPGNIESRSAMHTKRATDALKLAGQRTSSVRTLRRETSKLHRVIPE